MACVLTPVLTLCRWLSPSQSSGGRAMSVLRELAPAIQLRDRIAELEEANVELSARLQVRRVARRCDSCTARGSILMFACPSGCSRRWMARCAG